MSRPKKHYNNYSTPWAMDSFESLMNSSRMYIDDLDFSVNHRDHRINLGRFKKIRGSRRLSVQERLERLIKVTKNEQ